MPKLATWFTPSLQTISRSSGRSAVAAAAYRACTELHDERTGITHNFKPKAKRDLVCNVLVGVPNNDISKLWNDAERAENRNNSTVARELMLPLPHEWTDKQRRDCVYEIATMLNEKYKVAVQASIHRKSKTNVNEHGHIEFTTREVDKNGKFGKKTRILDDKKTNEVSKLRETICEIVNSHAIKNQSDWYVYAHKFSDIITDHVPTHHISTNYGHKQKHFIDLNRQEVAEARNELKNIKNKISSIDKQLEELSQAPTREQIKQQLKNDCDAYFAIGAQLLRLDEKLNNGKQIEATGTQVNGLHDLEHELKIKYTELDRLEQQIKTDENKELLIELGKFALFFNNEEQEESSYSYSLESVDTTQQTSSCIYDAEHSNNVHSGGYSL
jgi:flagellar biosynthesis chaperone FliJ